MKYRHFKFVVIVHRCNVVKLTRLNGGRDLFCPVPDKSTVFISSDQLPSFATCVGITGRYFDKQSTGFGTFKSVL